MCCFSSRQVFSFSFSFSFSILLNLSSSVLDYKWEEPIRKTLESNFEKGESFGVELEPFAKLGIANYHLRLFF